MNYLAHRLRSTCRICGASALERFLELGPTPLANSFLADPEEPEVAYPLDVYFCTRCSLVQLLDVIEPEVLFRDYIYVSGTSETMRRHFAEYASIVAERVALSPGDLVVEAASNDGTLLDAFGPYGVRSLGIEPARNIAVLARRRGIETVEEFFDFETASKLKRCHGPARVVLANNVLAHVDDPVTFLQSAVELVDPSGWVIVEVPYLGEMLKRLEYDTIYHEHLCYFSVSALVRLFETAGLFIRDVQAVQVHGGSLRVLAQPRETLSGHGPEVLTWLAREAAEGLTSVATFRNFAAAVAENRRALCALIDSMRSSGTRMAAYGAPAKGNTLLNYCGLGTDQLDFAVDLNPRKIGRFTPGQHIPILSTEALLARRPGCTLLLAWNFAEEVLRQQQSYRDQGGRFLMPIPEPRIV